MLKTHNHADYDWLLIPAEHITMRQSVALPLTEWALMHHLKVLQWLLRPLVSPSSFIPPRVYLTQCLFLQLIWFVRAGSSG